jgi:DNA-binding NtrC family response regulator
MEKILIVDDVEAQRLNYERIAKKALTDCQIFLADNGKEALEIVNNETDISLVILDINFSTLPEDQIISSDPHREGYIIAHQLRKINPDLQIIMTTCFDELEEPFVIRLEDSPKDIEQKIKLAMRLVQLERENKELRKLLQQGMKIENVNIVGKSEALIKILNDAKRAAMESDKEPILILGERGTGKELLAKFIHYQSARRHKPFITISCPTVQDNLVEGILFGSEPGAFTGAIKRRGRLEDADGGIVFFDEIGDMKPDMQTKLLRVLDGHGFERVGGKKTLKPDIRFIFATNQDLKAKIDGGEFRADFYDRLGALHLNIPPLRERKDDIPLLITHFLNELAKDGDKPKKLSPELMQLFEDYDWPGNVRMLERHVRGMAIMSSNEILDVNDLSENIKKELQVQHDNEDKFLIFDKAFSRFPESDKMNLINLFAGSEDIVTRKLIKNALGLGDAATNERIQLLIKSGLIKKYLRNYKKTDYFEEYWKWLYRNERNEK